MKKLPFIFFAALFLYVCSSQAQEYNEEGNVLDRSADKKFLEYFESLPAPSENQAALCNIVLPSGELVAILSAKYMPYDLFRNHCTTEECMSCPRPTCEENYGLSDCEDQFYECEAIRNSWRKSMVNSLVNAGCSDELIKEKLPEIFIENRNNGFAN